MVPTASGKAEQKFFDTMTRTWISFPGGNPDYVVAAFDVDGRMVGIRRRGSQLTWNGTKQVETRLGPKLEEIHAVELSDSGTEFMAVGEKEMRVFSLDGILIRAQSYDRVYRSYAQGYCSSKQDFYVMDGRQNIQFSKGTKLTAINPETSSDVFYKTQWSFFDDGEHGLAVGAFSLRQFIRYDSAPASTSAS